MLPKVKTLIIEDSGLSRIVFAEILRKDPQIEVVATACNGKEGVEKARLLCPDVIVTDVMMPKYDGYYVVKQIMQHMPTPIILLSTLEKDDDQIFEALSAGAFDFVQKEKVLQDVDHSHILHEKVRAAATIHAENLILKKTRQNQHSHKFDAHPNYQVIAIGASTGGPGAVESIVTSLPENLNIPVVIAQHMPSPFLESFARRLDRMTRLQVKLAKREDVLRGGCIYLAPGDKNTRVVRHVISNQPVISFTRRKFEEFNDPSVDCLFTSVAETFQEKAIGVILSGMGKDGSEGIMKIRNAGGFTIAQDEASSVVYGMPKAAVESGGIKKVVKLRDIPAFLISCL